jgi:hypothetical protein
LAWIEVKWCLDHGQHVALCHKCGGVFPLTRPYKRSVYLCSPECRKARRIEQAGGLEKQRELWRQAKRASRSRLEKGEKRRKRGFGGPVDATVMQPKRKMPVRIGINWKSEKPRS